MEVSENGDTPKSSILNHTPKSSILNHFNIGFSIIMILGYHFRRPLLLGCDAITGAILCAMSCYTFFGLWWYHWCYFLCDCHAKSFPIISLHFQPGLSKMRQASSCRPFFAAKTSAESKLLAGMDFTAALSIKLPSVGGSASGACCWRSN